MNAVHVTIVCHGDPERADAAQVERMLRDNDCAVEKVLFVSRDRALEAVREKMELRGQRLLALVDMRCALPRGWLDRLVREVRFSVSTGAAALVPEIHLSEADAVFCADARCTVIDLSKYPAHLRLETTFSSLGAAVADFLVRGIDVFAGTRALPAHGCSMPPPEIDGELLSTDRTLVERALRLRLGRRPGPVSIVMLSWNAPQYTKLALESIRAHTRGDYEVILVDNGSGPETTEWLKTLTDVRVIFNASNRGYAAGNNQGIAAARGEYVVLLNNDVVVTEGWLDGLLCAFDRIPGLGVSAPRSNRVAGDQQLADAVYGDLLQMQAYARSRRERFRDEGYLTDRAIGVCLCVDRNVIEEIGGIDEQYGAGNFEDDDFCLRVRAAGYRIFVCDDVFIHHFGSQTFAANHVDWSSTMRENWKKFARKWGYPQAYPEQGYAPGVAIARGFERSRHFVPLPQPEKALV